jgi:long-chain acyl-CoA synthetase
MLLLASMVSMLCATTVGQGPTVKTRGNPPQAQVYAEAAWRPTQCLPVDGEPIMQTLPWLASYPPTLQWDSPIPLRAIDSMLDDSVVRWPRRAALDFMGRHISFSELGGLVAKAAKGLQALGVGPGVHVGLFLANTPHYVIGFFAILKAGGVVVNYSPLDAERVLEHKIADSQTDVLITQDLALLYPQMQRMLGKTRLKFLVVGNIAEMSGHPAGVQAQLQAAKQLSEVVFDAQQRSFASLLDNDGNYRPHDIGDPKEALAVLQYTGGTTGLPKGAMLTHGNLTAANQQLWLTCTQGGANMQEGAEVFLAVLPPFHIYALSVNMLLGVRMGATSILHTRFDADAVLKELAAKKVTVFPGVPTMYTAINNHPDVEKFDLRALKFCGSGGAPLPAEVHQRFMKLTGCSLSEGWGMTETSPTGTFSPANAPQRVGSCGIPSPGISIQFATLDNPNAYAPLGERGEICIRGPNVMKGYWRAEDATKQAFNQDGYMLTGDVGYMDKDGYIFIVDRTKDMLLCSGFNVYPRTIEEAIYAHPDVAEVCVIGIPDEYRGQSPKAFIALKAGAAAMSLDEMKNFLRDRIGKHEMIGAIEIRDALPKTPVGKLSKKTLVDEEEAKREAA